MHLVIESKNVYISSSFQEFVKGLFDGEGLSSINKDELIEYLSENESDVFWDCLAELYPKGELITKISCEVAETVFISKTQENIRANRDDYDITIILVGDSDKVIESFDISGADILLKFLDDEASCSEFYAKVSGYIEKSLELFVDHSRWHIGFAKKDGSIIELSSAKEYTGNFDDDIPLLWFGPTGKKPENIWTIKYGEELAYGWFTDDQWSVMEYLIEDCNDSFGICFLAECGRWLPDIKEILDACPIKFEFNDTIETVNKKFKEFFEN